MSNLRTLMSERMFFFLFYRVIIFLWDIDISSDWLIITKSYPKVSYLWVTFCIFAGGTNVIKQIKRI